MPYSCSHFVPIPRSQWGKKDLSNRCLVYGACLTHCLFLTSVRVEPRVEIEIVGVVVRQDFVWTFLNFWFFHFQMNCYCLGLVFLSYWSCCKVRCCSFVTYHLSLILPDCKMASHAETFDQKSQVIGVLDLCNTGMSWNSAVASMIEVLKRRDEILRWLDVSDFDRPKKEIVIGHVYNKINQWNAAISRVQQTRTTFWYKFIWLHWIHTLARLYPWQRNHRIENDMQELISHKKMLLSSSPFHRCPCV